MLLHSCHSFIYRTSIPRFFHSHVSCRFTSSSSSTRWKSRSLSDPYSALARTNNLKSRAAFKLLSLDSQHQLFSGGQVVVDLGFAPGAWSQVAISKTKPDGKVIGVDVLPGNMPRGGWSLQGNFLSREIQDEVERLVKDVVVKNNEEGGWRDGNWEKEHVDAEDKEGEQDKDGGKERLVDVVLSDMSAPWLPTSGMWLKSISNPFYRMMNTSGIAVRDHFGSMDLCLAALSFCYGNLRPGGHFICKFYQGSMDKDFELRLKKLFEKVHREKPDASRKESKEGFFVALRRKKNIDRQLVFPDSSPSTDDFT